jgi:unsaturated rhamnogalacturonyl hydrolase
VGPITGDEAAVGEVLGVPEGVLRQAAERLVRHPFQAWFYGDSIGFEGLLAASELLGERRYRDFAYGFLRGWAARDEPRRPDDNTAPGLVLCQLAVEEGDDRLREAALRLGAHLASRRRVAGTCVTFEDARRSLRDPYGGEALDAADRALLADPGAGIYIDCLHFDPPFFARLAALDREAGWTDRAVEEAAGYVDLLQDRATGLFSHFWLERTGQAYGMGWGRGQGWAFLGLLDVLDAAPEDTPGRSRLLEAAGRLCEAMIVRQRSDGSWYALVDDPASGDETSTAAFMVVGFLRAARLGIDDPGRMRAAAERAWAATRDAVDETGLLTGVSAAVYSSTLLSHYRYVPRGYDVPWGQGPLLVAALERSPGQQD